jgi:hypothetical protein
MFMASAGDSVEESAQEQFVRQGFVVDAVKERHDGDTSTRCLDGSKARRNALHACM